MADRVNAGDGENPRDAELRRLRTAVDGLDERSRAITSPTMRHDIVNAVGAARNALLLLSENAEPEVASRFMEIATRNIERAGQLIRDAGRTAEGSLSDRDERNDLGSAGERDHRDTFGL
jgi:hypothetical protein